MVRTTVQEQPNVAHTYSGVTQMPVQYSTNSLGASTSLSRLSALPLTPPTRHGGGL